MSSRMATIKKTRKSKCYLLITSDAMQFYSAVRKNKILAFATWMELEGIMLSEIRQMEKDKYGMIPLTRDTWNSLNKDRKQDGVCQKWVSVVENGENCVKGTESQFLKVKKF